MIRKNIIYLNAIFFISFFIILFSLNFFYKKYVLSPKVDNYYRISAIQFYDFKSKSLKIIFDQIFNQESKKSEKYYIEKLKKKKANVTLAQDKTSISFNLITKNYFDEKELENQLNNFYINLINNIIQDIENNLPLYDYKSLREEYSNTIPEDVMVITEEDKEKEEDIEKYIIVKQNEAHDRLVNSEFFKEYPPENCSEDKINCLEQYITYYNFIYALLDKDYQNSDLLFFTRTKDKSNLSVFQDFYYNQDLFNDAILDSSFFISEFENKLKKKKERELLLSKERELLLSKKRELDFFSKKFDELTSTKFYSKYSFGFYCGTYTEDCLLKMSNYFNKILFRHKRESQYGFKVEYIKPKTIINQYITTDGPIILGLTTFLTYIFFILTNKFFTRKLK